MIDINSVGNPLIMVSYSHRRKRRDLVQSKMNRGFMNFPAMDLSLGKGTSDHALIIVIDPLVL